MATLQFDLYFVPRAGRLPLRNSDGYDVPALAESAALEAHAYLDKKIGKPWIMLKDWLVFGDEDSNRVDLLRTEDSGAELSARIDARSINEAFCNTVCELADLLHCNLFIAESGLPLEPDRAALVTALNTSRAAAFVRNPNEFMRGVQNVG